MKFIRIFLWGLVATMTLQGFLKADEYGVGASMMGGMSLTMSIWGEKAKGLVGLGPRYVPLPYALVVAALQETSRHPGIQAAPQLKQALVHEQQIWRGFRDKQIGWMLRHSALIGALQAEPSGRTVWAHWYDALNATERIATAQQADLCVVNTNRAHCLEATRAVATTNTAIQRIRQVIHVWMDVLQMQPVRAALWWRLTQNSSALDVLFDAFADTMAQLHNVSWAGDVRVSQLVDGVWRFAGSGVTNNMWLERLLGSLLEGEVWVACLEHVRQRESRIREMMTATGVQELYHSHERILNASLRVVTSSGTESRLIMDWFAEMGVKAWWMGDDIPAIVRRCVGTESGDCRRVGPTEIAAMSAHLMEAGAVLEDWTRRLFIGMWNGLPALALLFLVEFAVLCLYVRGPTATATNGKPDQQVMVLRLEPVVNAAYMPSVSAATSRKRRLSQHQQQRRLTDLNSSVEP